MAGEQVFILHDGSLLGRGIQNLLKGSENLRLVGAASTRGDARRQITAFNPDIIVIVGRLSGRNAQGIFDVMQSRPSSKVVTIGLGAEQVLLHHTEPITGNLLQDLIAAIISGPPNPQPGGGGKPGRNGNPRMG